MKIYWLILLFTILNVNCYDGIWKNPMEEEPLYCHVCKAFNSYNCEGKAPCTLFERFCVIVAQHVNETGFQVTKRCARRCPNPQNIYTKSDYMFAACCISELCNDKRRDGTGARLKASVLGVVLGAVASL